MAEPIGTLESFYEAPRLEIAEKLAAILAFRGIRTARRHVLKSALERFRDGSADFVDSLLAADARQGN